MRVCYKTWSRSRKRSCCLSVVASWCHCQSIHTQQGLLRTGSTAMNSSGHRPDLQTSLISIWWSSMSQNMPDSTYDFQTGLNKCAAESPAGKEPLRGQSWRHFGCFQMRVSTRSWHQSSLKHLSASLVFDHIIVPPKTSKNYNLLCSWTIKNALLFLLLNLSIVVTPSSHQAPTPPLSLFSVTLEGKKFLLSHVHCIFFLVEFCRCLKSLMTSMFIFSTVFPFLLSFPHHSMIVDSKPCLCKHSFFFFPFFPGNIPQRIPVWKGKIQFTSI